MNILKNTTFTWWQISLIKVCLLSLGIAVGAYFRDQLINYVTLFLSIGIILGIYFTYIWYKQ